MNELVSIIMPSYNTANYISQSIDSVINQTYSNWELIIIDDCSTDNTIEIVKTYSDERIRLLSNEKNSGAAVSRNYALREAKGEWIAFLDSDDLWMPDKLEKQISFLQKNNYSFSYTNYEEIDSEGISNGIIVTGPKRISKFGMICYCWPGCLTVMYNKKQIGDVQIADIRKNNDYAMWLKVSKEADCYLLDETLAKYRRGREGSISTNSIANLIGWHYKLYRFAENKNAISACFYTALNMVFGFFKKKFFVYKI